MGSVANGQFVASTPVGGTSDCPATGIKYLPKAGAPPASSTSSGTAPTQSGGAISGQGNLNVIHGSQTGCLISAGTWYVSGTCATYTATPSGKIPTSLILDTTKHML